MNHRLERASLLSAPSKRGKEYPRLVMKGGRTYEMTAALRIASGCLRANPARGSSAEVGIAGGKSRHILVHT